MRSAVILVALCALTGALAITNLSQDYDVQRVIPGLTHQGVTFTPNGDLYTSFGTAFCHFAGAANLPRGQTLAVSSGRCGTSNVGATNIVSTKNGRIYTVEGYEVDKVTFQSTRRWNTNCGATHGIAVDPRDNAVFVASVNNGKVWRIADPDAVSGLITVDCNAALYFDGTAAGVGNFDGITIGPDGTFYGAGYTQNKFVIVSPWSASTPRGTLVAAKNTVARTPDGISICVSNGNSFALVAMTSGSISRFALTGPGGAPVYTEASIATSVGGYLDFTTVDPKGCIWGTTLFGGALGMYRVTNADGTCGCASAQVPCHTRNEQCLTLSQILALRH